MLARLQLHSARVSGGGSAVSIRLISIGVLEWIVSRFGLGPGKCDLVMYGLVPRLEFLEYDDLSYKFSRSYTAILLLPFDSTAIWQFLDSMNVAETVSAEYALLAITVSETSLGVFIWQSKLPSDFQHFIPHS